MGLRPGGGIIIVDVTPVGAPVQISGSGTGVIQGGVVEASSRPELSANSIVTAPTKTLSPPPTPLTSMVTGGL